MTPWHTFAAGTSDLAVHGVRLLRLGTTAAGEFAGGLAYLATVRKDGGPRIHPISPALLDGHLYAFVLRHSPKCFDLLRDPRYALHSWPYPLDEQQFTDEEFYLSGQARYVNDDTRRAAVAQATGDTAEDGIIFELLLDRVLHKARRNGEIVFTKWAQIGP